MDQFFYQQVEQRFQAWNLHQLRIMLTPKPDPKLPRQLDQEFYAKATEHLPDRDWVVTIKKHKDGEIYGVISGPEKEG